MSNATKNQPLPAAGMKPNHTPGPWRVESLKPARFPTHRILTATDRYVAEVCIMAHNPASADARLIAAAPDLLAALHRCLREGDLPMGADMDARAAIAKATGEK